MNELFSFKNSEGEEILGFRVTVSSPQAYGDIELTATKSGPLHLDIDIESDSGSGTLMADLTPEQEANLHLFLQIRAEMSDSQ